MSDNVIISLISFAGSLLAAVFGLLNTVYARRALAVSHETKVAMVTLEKHTNSIKDALVKVTGEAAFAEGVKAGAAEGADAKKQVEGKETNGPH